MLVKTKRQTRPTVYCIYVCIVQPIGLASPMLFSLLTDIYCSWIIVAAAAAALVPRFPFENEQQSEKNHSAAKGGLCAYAQRRHELAGAVDDSVQGEGVGLDRAFANGFVM